MIYLTRLSFIGNTFLALFLAVLTFSHCRNLQEVHCLFLNVFFHSLLFSKYSQSGLRDLPFIDRLHTNKMNSYVLMGSYRDLRWMQCL